MHSQVVNTLNIISTRSWIVLHWVSCSRSSHLNTILWSFTNLGRNLISTSSREAFLTLRFHAISRFRSKFPLGRARNGRCKVILGVIAVWRHLKLTFCFVHSIVSSSSRSLFEGWLAFLNRQKIRRVDSRTRFVTLLFFLRCVVNRSMNRIMLAFFTNERSDFIITGSRRHFRLLNGISRF